MVIVFDGPEKSGKSSLIALLSDHLRSTNAIVSVRKWGPVDPDDRVYAEPLNLDVAWASGSRKHWAIWDRSWASEHVYAKLLSRDRRLRDDPWFGEWLHGRATPLKFMVLPEDAHDLYLRRTPNDLPVDPIDEYEAFNAYSFRFGWVPLINRVNRQEELVSTVMAFAALHSAPLALPPTFAGPADADVIVVGDRRNENASQRVPGAWLPFSTRYTTMFARLFGDTAMQIGWTNAHDCPPAALRNARYILSCGNAAATWVRNYVRPDASFTTHFQVAHPSWAYRFNTEKSRAAIREFETAARLLVS